jgi:hypothetical protein
MQNGGDFFMRRRDDTVKTSYASLWTTTFWERLKFLFHGKIWISTKGEAGLPIVQVDMQNEIFPETIDNKMNTSIKK